MDVIRLTELTETDFAMLVTLLAQLHGTPRYPYRRETVEVCLRENYVFIARGRLGRILGTATLVLTPRFEGVRAHLQEFVVHKDSRRHGIGTQLFKAVAETARSKRALQLELFTNEKHNAPSRRLYEKCGMTLRSDSIRYVMRNLPRVHA